MRLFLLFILLSTSAYAEENYLALTPTPIGGFTIPQKVEFSTLKSFYKMAVQEYKDANYGYAKELLEATVQRTDAFPKAYFYLGSIYGSIEPFKNPKIARHYYERCIAHKKTSNELKQICYIHLKWEADLTVREIDALSTQSKQLGDTFYSRWMDVGKEKDLRLDRENVMRAVEARKPNDKDIFKRANYIVGE